MNLSVSGLQRRIRSSARYDRVLLATMSVAHFLDDGLGRGYSTLLPLIRSALNLSYVDIGVIDSMQAGLRAVGAPLVSWISDKTAQRKLLLILGVSGFFIGTAGLGFAQNYPLLVAMILLAQLSSCIYHPQAVSILNFSFRERLHSAIGIHGAVGAMGLVACPILLSLTSETFGWRIAPTLVYAPILIFAIILMVLVLGDIGKSQGRGFKLSALRNSWLAITMLAVYSGLESFAFFNTSSLLPLYLRSIKGFDMVMIGLWLGMGSVGNIVGQLVIGFWTEKLGTRRLVLITSLLFGLFFYLFLAIDNYWLQLLLFVASSAANAAVFPLEMSVTTEVVEKEAVTTAFAIVNSLASVTRVVMSPVMGYLADRIGLTFAMNVALIPATLAGFAALGIRHSERHRH